MSDQHLPTKCPRVVTLIPGSATSKDVGILAILPETYPESPTIGDLIRFVLENVQQNPLNRRQEHLMQVVQNEMQGQYGVYVNESPSSLQERAYFKSMTSDKGVVYLGIQITISKTLEGGHFLAF